MDLISRKAVANYVDNMPSELTEDGRRMIRGIRVKEFIADCPSAFEGMTNGEVFEAIFPNCVDYKGCIEVKTRLDMGKIFRRTWWDRPYDKEWEL